MTMACATRLENWEHRLEFYELKNQRDIIKTKREREQRKQFQRDFEKPLKHQKRGLHYF